MTNEKAIDVLMYFLNRLSGMHYIENGIGQPSYKTEAFSKAMCSLAKEDKYRWHDLRKDPNDLPKDAETVLTYELFDTGEKAVILHKIRYFKDGVFPAASGELPDEIIAWQYIDVFEVKK